MILVSTGEKVQIVGIELLFESLKKYSRHLANEKIKVIVPSYAQISNRLKKFDYRKIDIGEKQTDRFYAKFVIPRFLKEFTSRDDTILYLDADHICRKEVELPALNGNEIYISSELKPLSYLLGQESENILKRKYDFLHKKKWFRHFNNSIIYCKSIVLQIINSDWHNIYNELYGCISLDYLEEISFSLALLKNMIQIKPCTDSLQSSFYNLNKDCSLFHYGGAYQQSKYIKNMLLNSKITMESKLNLIEGIIAGYNPQVSADPIFTENHKISEEDYY